MPQNAAPLRSKFLPTREWRLGGADRALAGSSPGPGARAMGPQGDPAATPSPLFPCPRADRHHGASPIRVARTARCRPGRAPCPPRPRPYPAQSLQLPIGQDRTDPPTPAGRPTEEVCSLAGYPRPMGCRRAIGSCRPDLFFVARSLCVGTALCCSSHERLPLKATRTFTEYQQGGRQRHSSRRCQPCSHEQPTVHWGGCADGTEASAVCHAWAQRHFKKASAECQDADRS